ncbi:MAG: type II toxin-antitoxin system VapC family toxin [Verrucomicrobiota bacterium]
MEIVYIETSVVSLLVANPSRDLVTAARQQATRDWWNLRRALFRCTTSDETLAEAARGDAEQARLRLAALATLPSLTITAEAENLAAEFLRTGALPPAARTDAVHLAVASAARTDYFLTWNCRHRANAQILRRLEREAIRRGWELPTVCTPLELMGDSPYENETDS